MPTRGSVQRMRIIGAGNARCRLAIRSVPACSCSYLPVSADPRRATDRLAASQLGCQKQLDHRPEIVGQESIKARLHLLRFCPALLVKVFIALEQPEGLLSERSTPSMPRRRNSVQHVVAHMEGLPAHRIVQGVGPGIAPMPIEVVLRQH